MGSAGPGMAKSFWGLFNPEGIELMSSRFGLWPGPGVGVDTFGPKNTIGIQVGARGQGQGWGKGKGLA